MSKTEKELLELAAKAAGYSIHSDAWACVAGGAMPKLYMGNGGPEWNPLEDDGDALRIARAVGMTIYFDSANQFCMMEHGAINGTCAFWGEYGDHSNMREAITWLAAQIGKTMP